MVGSSLGFKQIEDTLAKRSGRNSSGRDSSMFGRTNDDYSKLGFTLSEDLLAKMKAKTHSLDTRVKIDIVKKRLEEPYVW